MNSASSTSGRSTAQSRSRNGEAVGNAPDAQPTTSRAPNGRHAAAAVDSAEHIAIRIPALGDIRLPPPEHLAYYAGVGLLVALEILDWPAALALGVGHALISQQHNRSIQEFGEALEHME
jgi:hypothetical protein